MTITLYKYIYTTCVYKEINLKTWVFNITNFKVDSYTSIQDKYDHIKNILNSKWFVGEDMQTELINKLYICNKMYFGFNKLYAVICKKKAIKFEYAYDMCGNELSSLTDRCKINVIENNTIYTFRISDLIKIINDSLSCNDHFHITPKHIKNPFTNEPFTFSTLYHIYFTIKKSDFQIPILFQYFYVNNFDKHRYSMEYNYEILEYITDTPNHAQGGD